MKFFKLISRVKIHQSVIYRQSRSLEYRGYCHIVHLQQICAERMPINILEILEKKKIYSFADSRTNETFIIIRSDDVTFNDHRKGSSWRGSFHNNRRDRWSSARIVCWTRIRRRLESLDDRRETQTRERSISIANRSGLTRFPWKNATGLPIDLVVIRWLSERWLSTLAELIKIILGRRGLYSPIIS